jgi:hypothetical protein
MLLNTVAVIPLFAGGSALCGKRDPEGVHGYGMPDGGCAFTSAVEPGFAQFSLGP